MSKIRELLEIINRQNMVPSDSRYFDYERKLLNVIHAAVPELRALLAERDALRKRDFDLQIYADLLAANPAFKPIGEKLQSILNATLSEGERG